MAKKYFWKFTIDGDAEKGVKALKKTRVAVDEVEKSEKKATKTRKDHTTVSDGLTRAVKNLAGPVALGLLARKFAEVAREQDLMIGQLVTMTGAEDKAALAFEKLNRIATKTPFTLDQSVQGFVKLTALGLTPSERALLSYGNTASAMGKDLEQMIEAVADASTMEFERLKEFGIKARQEADTVSFTFQGVTTTVGKNAAEIEEFLMGIGENQFGDAMANQMERIPGLLSNLSDNWDNLFRTIGEGGGSDLYANIIKGLSSLVQYITDHVDDIDRIYHELIGGLEIAWASWSAEITKRIFNLNNNFSESADHIKHVYELSIAKIKGFWGTLLSELRSKYAEFIAFSAEAVALIPGMGDVANNMRSTAMALRFAAAEGDGFAQTLARITAEGEKQAEERAERERVFKEGVDRDLANVVRMVNARLQANAKEGKSAEELDIALEDLANTRGENAEGMSKEQKEADELIAKLEEEIAMISLSDAEKEFLNRTRDMSAEAIALESEEIRRLIGILHSEQAAQKALAEQIKQAEQIRKNMIENVQKAGADLLYTFFDEGEIKAESFFETLIQGWKRLLAEMTMADLTSMIFGGGGGGNLKALISGSGGSGGLLSAGAGALGGLGGLFGGGSALPAAGAGAEAWAGFYGGTSGASGGLMSSLSGFITSPAGIAAGVLIAGKLIHDKTSNPDGYTRNNAGFLTAPTPGAKAEYLFGTEAFASGFSPTGVARRADQAQAEEIIDIFRSVDKQVFDLVVALNGTLKVGTLGGLNQEATPGSSGTFLGSGRDANLGQQVNSFVGQLADNISGLDSALLDAVQSATSAEQVIQLLNDAVAQQVASTTELLETEKSLDAARGQALESYSAMVSNSLQVAGSISQLRSAIQSDIYRALGISEIRPTVSGSGNEQLAGAQALRDFLIQQYNEELQMERELHEERVRNYHEQLRLSKSLGGTINSLLIGDQSYLSSQARMDLAVTEFNRLATLAESGDLGAAGQVGTAGKDAIKLIRDMYASSSMSKELSKGIVDRLMGIQNQFSGATDPGEFNSSALTNQLVAELEILQGSLNKIQKAIAYDAVEELQKLGLLIQDLPPDIANALKAQLQAVSPHGPTSNYNPVAAPVDINQAAQDVAAAYGTGPEGIKKFIDVAMANAVGSQQVAEALGFTQDQVLEFAKSVGIDGFATGGIARGPSSGHIEILHGTEAVVPLPNGRSIPVELKNDALIEEIRGLRKDVNELKNVEMSGHNFASKQRTAANQRLESIEQRLSKVEGVGSAKYA